MTLNYREEMGLTAAFLSEMRLRLSDKDADVLPPEGKLYDGTEPNRLSLVGCIGPAPDIDYTGPQPPNSVGIVLLVSPDAEGLIQCELSGQFDLVHRYIPDIRSMARDVILDGATPRRSQTISVTFKRYTVCFSEITLAFDPAKPNEWMSAKSVVTATLNIEKNRWLDDPRIMRRCRLNPNGGARLSFEWSEAALADQRGLNYAVYEQIISDPNEILSYEINLRGRLRPAPTAFGANMEGRFLLELFLENQTTTANARAFGIEFPYLLDARLVAQLAAGTSHKVPHRLQPEDYRYRDDDGLPGYGVSCGVIQLDDNKFMTDGMPTSAQARVDAPRPGDVGMTHAPDYKRLAHDPLVVCESFLNAQEQYLGLWASRIHSLESAGLMADRDIAIADRDSFQFEISRIRDGVDLLREHDDLRQCFQWMNEAMARAIKMQGKKFAGWHLFQLGFILTQIRSIYERHAPVTELRGSMETADVLWFATGGGKTEAYLGIISMAMLFARMRGRDHGTTAWIRFPLRMLWVQQFQRLSFVLAQTNKIRQRENLGGWPLTIGYYTGDGTPSRISSTFGDDVQKGFLPAISEERLKAYQFISDCPYCGSSGSVSIEKDLVRARIKHVCTNEGCWSNTEADAGIHGEGIRGEIGIYVSDEECYRYLPSVLVGTVDKLAVIGHNKRFANYFGGARYFCPEHGFTQASKCEHRRIVKKNDAWEGVQCGNNTRTSELKVVAVPPMKDPGFALLVQDELHLLRESLGNFDAHYETLLSTLQISHHGRAPKVLAATATIKDFEDHIHHLYLRKAVRFPAPGVHQGESFYARKVQDTETEVPLIRRWFAGILPIGRGRIAMQAVAEVSSRFLDQVDQWRIRLAAGDPSLLTQLELTAAQAGDALRYIEKNLNTDLVYANSKRNITEIMRYMEEVNNKTGVERNARLLGGETRLDMILDAIRHVETKAPDDNCRHIIATSVVSHRVDIAELNFMIMAGWPKSTAEYIQASARSGRVHPGIVFCVLSSHQLFESGVFMNFGDYHTFLDRLVDSVPINRFAPNIIDRTLPGILSSIILNWARQQPWGSDISNYVSPLVSLLRGSSGKAIAEQIKTVVINSLRIPASLQGKFDQRVISGFNTALKERVDNAFFELENWPGSKNAQTISEALGDIFGYAPFRSFRDIENQILIKPVNSAADQVLMALAR
ncbi:MULTISPECIES: DEAD/DEAH box helicase family protein [unclassified Pseudomonas]|uniref:DEAD/DEAH box helicase family protein n=2 Tax=Pseudomonas TaxID=286 RepID=UPI002B23C5D9|nr:MULTISPECIES: DEAD/DEAH box helicase family protein [unclassified Pseudomonas]MEA9993198.1 DEAD/DEAH box helicase family protein [Pseudomonas sp. AA4]MEB0088022.1 DEAD/DEAH box helicase family protein [Pseudomonas sp. RTI1]MEB0124315.1 DEAD/DEAH box helicase family protein [Pseudomonas sp. CCC1.2]MEB0151919.1 DEAD/DEAH box helicase family protein [Pseudomonas sp. CCC4.3]MEB0218091.1 DEAD/DEAH box helicase family protein [Pseudomonas sp. AB12(2023)]